LDRANNLRLSELIVSFSTLHQGWKVITEMDGFEVSYRWFGSKKKAEDFALKLIS